jgi:hypothetical protein
MPKYEYGREGAYLQNEVFKRLLMWLAPVVTLAFISLAMAELRPPWWMGAGLLVFVPFLPAFAKRWERYADKSIDPYITGFRGERDVADALRACVGEDGYLVHDLDFGRGNVDHVAVMPAGIFAIETKAYAGAAWTKGDKLFVNGVDHEHDLKQTWAETLGVRDYLNRVSGGRRHFVTPLLVLSQAKVTAHGKCRGINVTGIDTLPQFFSGQQRLDQRQRSAIAAALGVKTAGR